MMEKHEFDQSAALIADALPPMWRRLYLGLLDAGFNEEEAMLLLRTYIHGAAGGKMEK